MLASVWVSVAGMLPKSGDARTAATKAELRALIQNLEGLISRRDHDVLELSNSVREQRRATKSSPTVQRSLKRILALKKSRQNIVQHLNTLETQLDAIESTAFNSQLVRTMQASATTMRRMGVTGSIKEADAALASIEDNLASASDLTSALSVAVIDNVDDDELEAELAEILGEADASGVTPLLQPPSVASSMQVPATLPSHERSEECADAANVHAELQETKLIAS
jgi:chaperonin cofactor prefoldin